MLRGQAVTPHPATERHSLSLSFCLSCWDEGLTTLSTPRCYAWGFFFSLPRSGVRLTSTGGDLTISKSDSLYNTTSSGRTCGIIIIFKTSLHFSRRTSRNTSTLCPLKSPVGLRQYKTGLASRVGAPSRKRAKFCVVCKSGLRNKASFFAARRRDCLGSRGTSSFFFFSTKTSSSEEGESLLTATLSVLSRRVGLRVQL